jgi:hypothetical protein
MTAKGELAVEFLFTAGKLGVRGWQSCHPKKHFGHTILLGCLHDDLLQGLHLSLHFLWICLYDSGVLVTEAAVMVPMWIVEQQSRLLVLMK